MAISNPILTINTPDCKIRIATHSPIKLKYFNNQISVNINPKLRSSSRKRNEFSPVPAITSANISPYTNKHSHHKSHKNHKNHSDDDYLGSRYTNDYSEVNRSSKSHKYNNYGDYSEYKYLGGGIISNYNVPKPKTPTFTSLDSKYSNPVYSTTQELYAQPIRSPPLYPYLYSSSTYSPMKRPTGSETISNINQSSYNFGTISNNYRPTKYMISPAISNSPRYKKEEEEEEEYNYYNSKEDKDKYIITPSDNEEEGEEEEIENDCITEIQTKPLTDQLNEYKEEIINDDDDYYQTKPASEPLDGYNEEVIKSNNENDIERDIESNSETEFNIINFLMNKCKIYNGDEYISYIMREWKFENENYLTLHHDYLQYIFPTDCTDEEYENIKATPEIKMTILKCFSLYLSSIGIILNKDIYEKSPNIDLLEEFIKRKNENDDFRRICQCLERCGLENYSTKLQSFLDELDD